MFFTPPMIKEVLDETEDNYYSPDCRLFCIANEDNTQEEVICAPLLGLRSAISEYHLHDEPCLVDYREFSFQYDTVLTELKENGYDNAANSSKTNIPKDNNFLECDEAGIGTANIGNFLYYFYPIRYNPKYVYTFDGMFYNDLKLYKRYRRKLLYAVLIERLPQGTRSCQLVDTVGEKYSHFHTMSARDCLGEFKETQEILNRDELSSVTQATPDELIEFFKAWEKELETIYLHSMGTAAVTEEDRDILYYEYDCGRLKEANPYIKPKSTKVKYDKVFETHFTLY